MDSIERKIVIKRFIGEIDTNNDGFVDSIGLVSNDIYVPITLMQSIKDLGVYTDDEDDEGPQILDLSSVWDDSNDGSGDGDDDGDIDGTIDNPYTSGLEVGGTGGDIAGCMDPAALNYSSAVTTPCSDCCTYSEPFEGVEGSGGGRGGTTQGGCHRLSSGCQSQEWIVVSGLSFSGYAFGAISASELWCKGTHSSCGGAYQ